MHERLSTTTVYVTHDQIEAMTLGHRVAVLRDGVLQQLDAPQELYHHPVNVFVAAFIGSPAMNLVEAHVERGVAYVGELSIHAPHPRPELTQAGSAGSSIQDGRLLADDERSLMTARVLLRASFEAGETVELAVDHRRLYFFDRETGRALHVEEARRPEPINH
jgi:ABC-type Fe3+/spermidine/putrescine transport system ATPase subunit